MERDLSLAERLRHVAWIGGGTGAGKTSIATALAERHGLQAYHYDWHDARDHTERIDPSRHPVMHRWATMSMDERWVLRTPEEMAKETIESSRERMDLVIEDLRARPSGTPIVAEGFGFYPEFIAPLLSDTRQAIWLVPTTAFRERALQQRGWTTVEGTSDGLRARANRLARDALLTEHVRRSARALGLRVLEVDGTQSLAEVTALVDEHLAWMLPLRAPRTRSEQESDERSRRALVASFTPFLARCTRGHAVLERVAIQQELASHQLGLLNSAYLAAGHAPVNESALRDAVPFLTRSRLGAEHWRSLVSSGFAREHPGGGWILTERGRAAVTALYRAVWAEVAAWRPDPALVGRVGEILERLSYLVPMTNRARLIRAQWADAAPTTLVRLYRAVWELSIYRDVCFRASWEAESYSGPLIDVLTHVRDGAITVDALVERLTRKQEPTTVDANLRTLAERGDVERSSASIALTPPARATLDRIEARADAVYFERWPIGQLLGLLHADFDALMRALE